MTGRGFRQPMLATLVDDVVEGDRWIFERKLDGIRLIVARDGDDARLFTRSGHDRSSSYPEVVAALAEQPCRRFVADGEVVAFDGPVTSFARLQQRSGITDPDEAQATGIAVHLYLFDLLEVDGEDISDQPLRTRKSRLRRTLDFGDHVRFCPHRNAEGAAYLAEACERGWEGLIAKRADRPYRSGRSRDWLKLECVARQEFVIGGYTDPEGERRGFGALLLGYHDDGRLVYAGRVGTGFDEATLADLTDRLVTCQGTDSPFADPPGGRGVHWVSPELVAEVGFTEWTRAGRLRHPRYLGVRHDKDPAEVVRERPQATPT